MSRALRRALEATLPQRHLWGHHHDTGSAHWSPDSRHMLAYDDMGFVSIWETGMWKLVQQFVLRAAEPLARFEPVRPRPGQSFWDTAHRLNVSVQDLRLSAIEWTPDGRSLLLVTQDGRVGIRDIAGGELQAYRDGAKGWPWQIVWRQDGPRILSRDDEQGWRLWDWTTLTSRSLDSATVATLSRDGLLLTGHPDGTARLWDADGHALLRELAGHDGAISALAWHPDGSQALTGGATGRVVRRLAFSDQLIGAAFSPNGRRNITIHYDFDSLPNGKVTLRVWNIGTGALEYEQTWNASGSSTLGCQAAWHPDGQQVAIATGTGAIELLDVERGRIAATLAPPWWRGPDDPSSHHMFEALAWSPDGARLLAAADNTVRIWEHESGKLLGDSTPFRSGVDPAGIFVGWAATGPQALAWYYDGQALLWDAASDRQIAMLEGSVMRVAAVAWSPDGRSILAGDDRAAWIWDSATGQALQLLEGHTGYVQGVAWSADGQVAYTVDTVLRAWVVAPELLEAELVRRVCETHVDSCPPWQKPREIDAAVRREVPGWRGAAAEMASAADALARYDRLCDAGS